MGKNLLVILGNTGEKLNQIPNYSKIFFIKKKKKKRRREKPLLLNNNINQIFIPKILKQK
jgi:hypothetical protein